MIHPNKSTLFFTLLLTTFLLTSSFFMACEDQKETGTSEEEAQITICERQRRPIIFIHGFLAAGDTWNRQITRLLASGSCPEDIQVFDWNSLDMSADHSEALDLLITNMLASSDFNQVDLVGHSAGGGVAYTYLAEAEYNAKVNRYVHVASFPNDAPAGIEGNIPTLNLWSSADLVVEGADIPGATNVELMGLDHYLIATSFESFNQMIDFLYEAEPLENDPFLSAESEMRESIQVAGKVLSLGENQALSQTEIELWEVDDNGQRIELISILESDADGGYLATNLKANTYYEWVPNLTDSESPKVRYFTPKLKQDQGYLYLRTFPGEGSLASILVRQLPQSETQSSLVIFNAHRAFLAEQDQLTLDGTNILSPEVASAENTTIALFVFDINEDGQTDGRLPLFEGFPFLSVVDYPIEAEANTSLNIAYNGVELNVPKSASKEGTIIVIFP